jgi:hypothetical protein
MEITNFTIKCKNPQCVGGRIETTMEDDSGYSNWTVMDNGYVEFKCHGCGKFGSTDEYKKPNELNNFEVKCDRCGGTEWTEHIGDVDNEDTPTHIECKGCGAHGYTCNQK